MYLAAVIAAVLRAPRPLHAETFTAEAESCGAPTTPTSARITACTNVIESGKGSAKQVARAYYNRAKTYNELVQGKVHWARYAIFLRATGL
jgi:hypothetical protein